MALEEIEAARLPARAPLDVGFCFVGRSQTTVAISYRGIEGSRRTDSERVGRLLLLQSSKGLAS
jgi:hypothetical protein